MSLEQREDLDRLLREAPLDLGRELAEQRQVMEEMMAGLPSPSDVETTDVDLDGIPVVLVETDASTADRAALYLHGGAYALGSARAGVGLASEVAGRRPRLLGRLPARARAPLSGGVEDCVAAYRGLLGSGLAPERIVVVGESASPAYADLSGIAPLLIQAG